MRVISADSMKFLNDFHIETFTEMFCIYFRLHSYQKTNCVNFITNSDTWNFCPNLENLNENQNNNCISNSLRPSAQSFITHITHEQTHCHQHKYTQTQSEHDSLATSEPSVTRPQPNNAIEPQTQNSYGESSTTQTNSLYNAKQQPLVSSMAKHKSNAIKIQIQGSQSNLNSHTNYRRHISFDDSCKKEDGDEVRTQIYSNLAHFIE